MYVCMYVYVYVYVYVSVPVCMYITLTWKRGPERAELVRMSGCGCFRLRVWKVWGKKSIYIRLSDAQGLGFGA